MKGVFMNNSINPVVSPNFRAKLDISKIKGDKERWSNIAKIFENKTKKIAPNDTFKISGSFNSGLKMPFRDKVHDLMFYGTKGVERKILQLLKDNGYIFTGIAGIDKNTSKSLKSLSDKEIAQELTNFVNENRITRADWLKTDIIKKEL